MSLRDLKLAPRSGRIWPTLSLRRYSRKCYLTGHARIPPSIRLSGSGSVATKLVPRRYKRVLPQEDFHLDRDCDSAVLVLFSLGKVFEPSPLRRRLWRDPEFSASVEKGERSNAHRRDRNLSAQRV